MDSQQLGQPDQPEQPASGKKGLWAFVLLTVVALVVVLLAWFRTPVIQVPSFDDSDKLVTMQCANAGPSRWNAPISQPGQEISSDPKMVSFSLSVMKNDLESLRKGFACEQARSTHTNTLIVTTFAAGTAILLGYAALNRSRSKQNM